MSGLSMVSVFCEEFLFLNGVAVHQIWFQVRFFFVVHYQLSFFIDILFLLVDVSSLGYSGG